MKELFYNGVVYDDNGGKHHCVGTKEDPESLLGEFGFYGDQKDAKLIAAAPNLLESLKTALSYLNAFKDKFEEREKILYHQIKKAIEKTI